MVDYNTYQEEDEEMPFDVERQSRPLPALVRVKSESRVESMDLSVPHSLAASAPAIPVESRPMTPEPTSNVTDSSPSTPPTTQDITILKDDEENKVTKTADPETPYNVTDSNPPSPFTPPRLSRTTFSEDEENKVPQTPDTMFSNEEEEVERDVYTSKNHKKEGGGSSCTSKTTDQENPPEDSRKQTSLRTLFAKFAILLMVILIIMVMIVTYLVLFRQRNTDIVPDGQSTGEFPDWGTFQPTVSADLTLSPTQTPTTSDATASPTRLVVPSSPTLPPALSSVLITQTPTTSNPTTSPTKTPSLALPPALASVLITKAPSVSTPNPTTSPNPPTLVPTSNPTNRPTQRPTLATLNPTTARSIPSSPTLSPTQSPTSTFGDIITDFLFTDISSLQRQSAENTAVPKALKWLVDEADAARAIVFSFDQKYLQRYAILKLYFSVDETLQSTNTDTARLPNLEMRDRDECSWSGVTCDVNGLVTSIKLSNRELQGTLPSDWESFPNLKSIDFSSNKLKGSIPEKLYDILGLEDIFLYKNQLTGTVSSKIGDLWSLRSFHLSHNRLSGSIPPELASTESRIRQIRHFNVHRNQMTGSIPSNMRLRQLYLMDLGNNQFSGEVPEEFGPESVRLRHLFLDHNKFSGTFPSSALNAGDGRLDELFINDNEFSGTFPGDHKSTTAMYAMTIQNNNFVSMQRNSTCELDVFSGGELVEFKSECLICRCGFSLMCQNCVL